MKNEYIFLTFLILPLLLVLLFLPIYDQVNGFHNIIQDEYILTWYDGRSPANFHIIKNIMENGSISFSKGYLIGDILVENHFDFFEKDERYYPAYFFFGDYVYASILYFFSFPSDLQLFKAMSILNMVFFMLILIIFYYIQKSLGLKLKYRLTSTFIAGLATSILIYSRYFFIKDMLSTLYFLIIIFLIIKSWKKPSIKSDILFIVFNLSLFLVTRYIIAVPAFTLHSMCNLIITMFIFYLTLKYKLVNSIKLYSLLYICGIILIIFSHDLFFFHVEIPVESRFKGVLPNYIPALDFLVYGYHDPSSVWRLDRYHPVFYLFQQKPGNAIFMHFYGLFSSLFGPKGIIYNSPFLVFSVLGIILYKSGKNKILILFSILLFVLIYGLFYGSWYGGVTPRYNRFLTIPVLFLTFFSFYYIQKTKSVLAKSIFLILVILSVLNVASLAMRTDWTYEHEADLVSYDLVLWPWYSLPEEVTKVTNETTILLTSKEIPNWKLSGEGSCKATFGGMGLITDTCYCAYDSWAERKIGLEKDVETIEIKACSAIAGNDGTRGSIYIDDELIGEMFIESNSCATKTFSVNISPGIYTIKLKSGKYRECNGEMVYWKSIKFEFN